MADQRRGVANSDFMVDPFPGIPWSGNLAPGSVPDRAGTKASDNVTGVEVM
jgi:hypothetical protein